MLPKHILVPTDLGEGTERALDLACELAQSVGARVHLLNVISIPSLGVPELGVALTGTMVDRLVTDSQDALDKLAAETACTAQLGKVLVRAGDARDMINQTARDLSIDLIVMGTHGRRGITRALLGSVAEAVIRSAPCAVLTVRLRELPARDDTRRRAA